MSGGNHADAAHTCITSEELGNWEHPGAWRQPCTMGTSLYLETAWCLGPAWCMAGSMAGLLMPCSAGARLAADLVRTPVWMSLHAKVPGGSLRSRSDCCCLDLVLYPVGNIPKRYLPGLP